MTIEITLLGTGSPIPDPNRAGPSTLVRPTLDAFGFDIGYRTTHHADLNEPPPVEVHEYTSGEVFSRDGVSVVAGPTDQSWETIRR